MGCDQIAALHQAISSDCSAVAVGPEVARVFRGLLRKPGSMCDEVSQSCHGDFQSCHGDERSCLLGHFRIVISSARAGQKLHIGSSCSCRGTPFSVIACQRRGLRHMSPKFK